MSKTLEVSTLRSRSDDTRTFLRKDPTLLCLLSEFTGFLNPSLDLTGRERSVGKDERKTVDDVGLPGRDVWGRKNLTVSHPCLSQLRHKTSLSRGPSHLQVIYVSSISYLLPTLVPKGFLEAPHKTLWTRVYPKEGISQPVCSSEEKVDLLPLTHLKTV